MKTAEILILGAKKAEIRIFICKGINKKAELSLVFCDIKPYNNKQVGFHI